MKPLLSAWASPGAYMPKVIGEPAFGAKVPATDMSKMKVLVLWVVVGIGRAPEM